MATVLDDTLGRMTIATKAGKKAFVRSLCNSVRDVILANVGAMPDEWDGHELRELLAAAFAEQRGRLIIGKRKRDYRNAVATGNLTRRRS